MKEKGKKTEAHLNKTPAIDAAGNLHPAPATEEDPVPADASTAPRWWSPPGSLSTVILHKGEEIEQLGSTTSESCQPTGGKSVPRIDPVLTPPQFTGGCQPSEARWAACLTVGPHSTSEVSPLRGAVPVLCSHPRAGYRKGHPRAGNRKGHPRAGFWKGHPRAGCRKGRP